MTGRAKRAPRLTRAAAGANSVLGYGLSMLLLAVASLAAIPAMVTASGAHAWGAIALGQSIGAIAAVVIAYGWGMSGPARIARADAPSRLREYAESVAVKLLLLLPGVAVAVVTAVLIARGNGAFAAAGALSAASIGLTANWYFVGLARPYLLLALETLPRIAGTVAGILLMLNGADAAIGVLLQFAGMLAAFGACTLWVLRPGARAGSPRLRRRPIRQVLLSQRHGVVSTTVSAVYIAAPLVIVSTVAPLVQPVYAIVDKVQRQISVALNPFVTVLQGWVPRAEPEASRARIRMALLLSAGLSLLLGTAVLLVAPEFIRWLGGSQIHPPYPVLVLMAVFVALNLWESVVSKAVLSTVGRLDLAARGNLIGAIVGLPLVAVGAVLAGALGALAAVVLGLAVRLGIELGGLLLHLRRGGAVPIETDAAMPALPPPAPIDPEQRPASIGTPTEAPPPLTESVAAAPPPGSATPDEGDP